MTKIMLVEDDNNLREIYEARLSAEGYEIVAAQNGEAALAIAAKERPDLIISDVMMPKISGFEMLDILRNTEALRNVKVIMLTALGQAEDSQRANSLGADRYLVKSQVTLEDIVKAAHELLDDPSDTPPPLTVTEPETTAPEPAAAAPPAPTETPVVTETAEPQAPAPEVVTEPAAAFTPEPTPVTEPASESTVEAPPAAEAPVVAEPEVANAPELDPAPEVVTEPIAGPTETTDTTSTPSVISIPVSDGPSDDTSAPSATTPASDTAMPASDATTDTPVQSDDTSSMSVVEPPAEGTADTTDQTSDTTNDDIGDVVAPPVVAPPTDLSTPSEEATEESTEGSETSSYTSPTNFNNFQAEPTVSGVTAEVTDANPQSLTSEEESIKAQIDSFISDTSPQTDTTTTTEPTTETPEAVDTSIGVIADNNLPVSPVSDVGDATSVSSEDIPTPEELDTFDGPTISAPEQSATQPSSSVAQNYEEQLVAAAAEDLATSPPETSNEPGAAAVAAGSTTSNRMKTISPINTEAKPSLDQLLEREEAKTAAQQAAMSTEPPKPNVSAYNPAANTSNPQQPPATNGNSVDPNSISL